MKIAIVGDIHGHFTEFDVEYLNNSSYDLLLFTGDLPSIQLTGHHIGHLYELLRALKKESYLIPGNHDSTNMLQLAGELFSAEPLVNISSLFHENEFEKFQNELGNIKTGGYKPFITRADPNLAILLGRPFSMGGKKINFSSILQKKYSVSSFEESTELLLKQAARIKDKEIILLLHNGPEGLGAMPGDTWGCDFCKTPVDWGDTDMSKFLEQASASGQNIPVVVAGHMHYSMAGKKFRKNIVRSQGQLFINAARVPRITTDKNGKSSHFHISLTRSTEGWQAREVVVERN